MIPILILIFVALAAAYLHGIHEGMIMIQDYDIQHNYAYPGVRGHDWFGCYHLISGGRDMIFIAVGAMGVAMIVLFGYMPAIKILPGIALLAWELSEIGYAEARGGKMIYKFRGEAYEHVFFTDWLQWKLTGWRVYWLHGFRIIAGISLLIGGVK